jgi:hypothetical protein
MWLPFSEKGEMTVKRGKVKENDRGIARKREKEREGGMVTGERGRKERKDRERKKN